MKTLKEIKREKMQYLTEHPEFFKKGYSRTMGGTQTVTIEGVGSFEFDDRCWYTGRGKKYNRDGMHEELGEVVVTAAELDAQATKLARIAYGIFKRIAAERREERKAYKAAVELIGRDRLDAGIALVKKFSAKTYYFIGNVEIFKAYSSDSVTIRIVSDDYRRKFDWAEWYAAPYAAALGMTPENKNLFIC